MSLIETLLMKIVEKVSIDQIEIKFCSIWMKQ